MGKQYYSFDNPFVSASAEMFEPIRESYAIRDWSNGGVGDGPVQLFHRESGSLEDGTHGD